MVYVLSKSGQPLMPTRRHGKVKHLLRFGRAKVIKRCPFTIQLTYDSDCYTQPITLGVDAGSKHIGVCATTEKETLYTGDITLRKDVTDLLDVRRQLRRGRRYRKLRYRAARFNNRLKTKHQGWLAPSIHQKIESHLKVVEDLHKILPITNIIIETAQFDTQLLKAMESGLPIPEGTDYQKGELYGFANLREYCFYRDNYTCQWCNGKSKDPVLHIHHWNYWNGDHTNKPSSVITLCGTCNDSKNHKPEAKMLWGWHPKITKSYKDATFMGIMRWSFYNQLKALYPNVHMTYGYITKAKRIELDLSKTHYMDAYCIADNLNAVMPTEIYNQKKVRCHNRQLHKTMPAKGGIRKVNQAPKFVKGFQLFDKVLFETQECFIYGRRSSGYFDIRKIDGTVIHRSASYKKLKIIQVGSNWLIERALLTRLKLSVSALS